MKIENLTAIGFNGERKVRQTLGEGVNQVKIYEPTEDNIQEIIDITQEVATDSHNTAEVTFTEQQIVEVFLPMLTNIETQHLTEDEITIILVNKSTVLMSALQVIGQIISECSRLYIERLYSQIIYSENMLAETKLVESLPKHIEHTIMETGTDEQKSIITNIVNIQRRVNDLIESEEIYKEGFLTVEEQQDKLEEFYKIAIAEEKEVEKDIKGE